MATTSPLRQRMIEDMTILNLSPATQQSYIYAVRKFSRHFGTSPDRLGIEDVRAYQLHLIAKKRSWSHVNQAACALRFFFGVTMGQQDAFERIVFTVPAPIAAPTSRTTSVSFYRLQASQPLNRSAKAPSTFGPPAV
jgi:Phage integrase, N-terminal SAM-like domain